MFGPGCRLAVCGSLQVRQAPVCKPDLYNYKSFDETPKRALSECELRADQLRQSLETKPSVAFYNKVRYPWALPAGSLVAFLGGSFSFSQLLFRRVKETWRAGVKSDLFRVCQVGFKIGELWRFAGRRAQKWLHAHLWSCTNRRKRR